MEFQPLHAYTNCKGQIASDLKQREGFIKASTLTLAHLPVQGWLELRPLDLKLFSHTPVCVCVTGQSVNNLKLRECHMTSHMKFGIRINVKHQFFHTDIICRKLILETVRSLTFQMSYPNPLYSEMA